ncbi:hypothetical protein KAW38_02040 [Candidatus Micrarchaeota archaeon]|nr:hypothetical protein [Candidatus Micrarchaeota archaeon]
MDPFASINFDWFLFGGLIILVSGALSTIVYLIGIILMNENVKTWAKTEFVELFFSMFFLAATVPLVLSTVSAADVFSASIYPSTYSDCICAGNCATPEMASIMQETMPKDAPCHIKLAIDFLQETFRESKDFMKSMFKTYVIWSFLSSISFNMDYVGGAATGSFNFSPFQPFMAIQLEIIAYMFDFLIKTMFILKFQEILMGFISTALFPVLLISGLVLRSLYLTRRLGGLLMAIAISLYFIFPMFYVLGGIVLHHLQDNGNGHAISAFYVKADGQLGKMLDDDSFEDAENLADAKKKICNAKTNLDIDNIQGGFEQVYSLYNEVKVLDADAISDSGWIMGEGGIIDGTSRVMFFSFFFSFLSLMSTIAAVRSLSPMLGGDVEIAGLTHLV